MSSVIKEQAAFLLDFCTLIKEAGRLDFIVTSGELLRTLEQQKIYVQTGRSKTMHSLHLRKLAGDLNFFLNGMWINGLYPNEAKSVLQPVGSIWEALHPSNRWGGNFKGFVDAGHFERNV